MPEDDSPEEDALPLAEATRVPGAGAPGLRWGIRILALLAAGLALYLATLTAGETRPPGCAPGGLLDCDHVLTSHWARWLGIPVAWPGAALYLAIFALGWFPRRPLALILLTFAAVIAASAAGWFVFLQAAILERYCLFCMAVHSLGILIGLLVALDLSKRPGRPPLVPAAVGGLLLASLLPLGQWLGPGGAGLQIEARPSTAAGAPAPGELHTLPLFDGELVLRTDELPRLGPADARRQIVELFDYTCPHCRAAAPMLEEARAHFGGDLAILPLVIPLEADCNPLVETTPAVHTGACALARLSLAVWRAQPEAFADYHAWLLRGETPPAEEAARRRAAERLGGTGALEAALTDPWVERQLDGQISLYERLGAGPVPILVGRLLYARGQPANAGALIRYLESQFSGSGPDADSGSAPRVPDAP